MMLNTYINNTNFFDNLSNYVYYIIMEHIFYKIHIYMKNINSENKISNRKRKRERINDNWNNNKKRKLGDERELKYKRKYNNNNNNYNSRKRKREN